MRNRKAAGIDADVLVRIAQIERMTLDQIAAFQRRILTEITNPIRSADSFWRVAAISENLNLGGQI
jgi:hypothetical protein